MNDPFWQNDLELTKFLRRLARHETKLNHLTAERKLGELRRSLNKVHDASRKALWRLQEIAPK